MIDNLRAQTLPAAECVSGAQIADSDGDGLLDTWETDGYDHDGNGTVDVDLPAMGADPKHKDLFVEMDAMPKLRLSNAAIADIAAGMAAAPVSNLDGTTGITLHVDNGSGSIMNPKTGATWGVRSKANQVAFQKSLGTIVNNQYEWSAFDSIKDANFDDARLPLFRYGLSINRYANTSSSGIARGIPGSDLIVSLGTWCSVEGECPGAQNTQAGTLMHELGHTLNLRHGGGDDINNKPNYLSVMNYSFQFSGLVGPHRWDYSRFGPSKVFDLWEGGLSEANGFGPLDTDEAGAYRTVITCPPLSIVPGPTRFVRRSIDFNCNGSNAETNVVTDLNGAGGDNQILRPFDDWPVVKLQGGAIGGAGLDVLLPDSTEADEATADQLTATQLALIPAPKVDAGAVTAITATSATLNGSFDTPAAATVSFRYGLDGGALDEQTGPQTITPGSGTYAASISSLQDSRTYRARPVITTADYETVGADMLFTAGAALSVVAPNPQPGPNIPNVGVVTVMPASGSQCVKPTTKSRWRACYKKRQKASCATLRAAANRLSCRTKLIARVCVSAATSTRGTKKAKAKLRSRCVVDLRKVAKIRRR